MRIQSQDIDIVQTPTKESTQTPSAEPRTTIEDNPIGLTKAVTEKVIPDLDKHVSSLFILFHQYQKHHWLVRGPQFRDLHLYLEEAYTEIHEDLDALAERVTVLGGIPTSAPSMQSSLSYISHEQEGELPVRDMLKRDRAAEESVIVEMRATIEEATTLKDFGTETLLKQMLLRAEDRAHHLDHYLEKEALYAPSDSAKATHKAHEAHAENGVTG
jgi:DNA-binding ferritin-like protein